MRRSRASWAAILLILGLAVPAAAPAAAATRDKLTFALNFVPYGIHTAFYAAQEKGFYERANLNVTIERGAGSADTVTKVAAGAMDVGFADAGSVVVGRSKGAKVTMVAMILDKGVSTIYTYKGSGITRP